MVYTGYQFEENVKGFNVCYVECGRIVEEKDVTGLNLVFSWITGHRQRNVMKRTYDKNFKFINDHNIKVGDIVREKSNLRVINFIPIMDGFVQNMDK